MENNYELMYICYQAAHAGGNAVADYKVKQAKTKGDVYVGHHAIVTSADFKSQSEILREIREHDPVARFMTEEHVKDKWFKNRLIKADNLDSMLNSRVYVIDELDGTSSKKIGHYEWSISVGCVQNLEHIAGAIFAPHVYRGTLFCGAKGHGAHIKINSKTERCNVSDNRLSNSYVIVGVDCFLSKYPIHNKLLQTVGDKCRTINANGSCALPLGLVASGRADVLIQPPQCPWDWVAGKLLVEEAGGSVLFYEMESKKIKFLDKLEPKHYHPEKRAVGFIAGNKKLVSDIMDLMLKI
ncbi:hypothetical protein HYW75_01185 [Candidatus Pacearchaeota archaeon]|nr:hypothetical protein [Candidatus Pacearchaeota archaeon]